MVRGFEATEREREGRSGAWKSAVSHYYWSITAWRLGDACLLRGCLLALLLYHRETIFLVVGRWRVEQKETKKSLLVD